MAKKKPKSNPCEICEGKCCKHVALPIDDPETKRDFDDLRWYVAHRGVAVFVEDDDWYVMFKTRCRYLDKDYKCKIYETRPKICRKYSVKNCELTGDGEAHDVYLDRPEKVEAYAKEFFNKKKTKDKGKSKKRK